MGVELNDTAGEAMMNTRTSHPTVTPIPWLDGETAAAVIDITRSIAERHPEVQAVILFGSVARREERPLDDPEPSDVDLLLVLDATALDPRATRLTHAQELALTATIGEADYRHRDAPREIKVLFLYRDLSGWDSTFIENVAHDGLLLWRRSALPGALPAPLAPVAARAHEAGTPH